MVATIKTPWGSELTDKQLLLIDSLVPIIKAAITTSSDAYEAVRMSTIETHGYAIFREAQTAVWFLLFGKS